MKIFFKKQLLRMFKVIKLFWLHQGRIRILTEIAAGSEHVFGFIQQGQVPISDTCMYMNHTTKKQDFVSSEFVHLDYIV